ncbi:hypothetical protein ACTMS0_01640 [Micromonospora sp. H33]|uniref:hypothetical protein n=1 Tax=Micromonospora sp. H33 TaxID=3452215 RepID=UPI003F8A340F
MQGSGAAGLWGRRVVAGLVGAGASGVAAVVVARMPVDTTDDEAVGLVVWLLTGALLLLSRERRPRRRARLVWRARVAGLHGVEPGLVGRRSVAGWAEVAREMLLPILLALMLVAWLPGQEWSGWARIVVAVGVGVLVGRMAYDVARFTGAVALTASGIRQGRRQVAWVTVDQTLLRRSHGHVDGVYLRTVSGRRVPRSHTVGGRTVAVPDERLRAAIDHYRGRPEMLAVGLPVEAPEPAAQPPG